MPAKARSIFRYTVSFLIAIAFLYLAFRGVKLSELWESLKGVNYWWIALLFPINIFSHWIRAVRWAHLLSPIRTNISKRNLFSAVMIGYAVNNVLPRVGEFIRPYVIGKLENISKTSAFGTVVAERILDLISFYFMVCIVLFIFPHSLDPFVTNVEIVRPFFLLGSIAGLIIFIFLFFKAEAFFRLLARVLYFAPTTFVEKVEKMLEKFYSGFAVAKVRAKLPEILFHSFLILLLYALGMYIPFFAFPHLVRPELDFGAAVVLLVISSISWLLPAPGALGTYHSFLTVAMVKLYNVDITTALSYAILTHGITYIIAIIFGVYYYFSDHLKLNELKTASSKIEK
jgi:glycosyltransferase 2 family protein